MAIDERALEALLPDPVFEFNEQRQAAAAHGFFCYSTRVPGAESSNTETVGGVPSKPSSLQRATTRS